MATVVIYDAATRDVLTINPLTDARGNPILPVGVQSAVAVLSDEEAAKFATSNSRFTIAPDGSTVVVTTAPVDTVRAEREAALSDLQANYQVAITRLDDIVTNGGAYTAAQVRDAVIDEARILRRALRVVRAELY